MAARLAEAAPPPAPYPILLVDGEAASGLADLLCQYLEQSVAASPAKRARARRLRGAVLFRAAEDEAVVVRVVFGGDRIELRDAPPGAEGPSVRADFLSLAHLASGQASPVLLLARGLVRLRCPVRALPFLLRVLGFLEIEDAPGRARIRWVLAALAVLAMSVALAAGLAGRC